jgi:hypothetical protein
LGSAGSQRACKLQYRRVQDTFGGRIVEIAAAACIWRDLAPTTESIAWDGIRSIRANLS